MPIDQLSHAAKITYGRLLRYAGRRGIAYPTVEVLAVEIGTSTRSATDYIKELKDFGLIGVEKLGGKNTNQYYFIWHAIFDNTLEKKLRQNPAYYAESCVPTTQNPAYPKEEKQLKKGAVGAQNSGQAVPKRVIEESHKKDDVETTSSISPDLDVNIDPDVDEDGNPLVDSLGRYKSGRKIEKPIKEGKNKIALRIQHKFGEMCKSQLNMTPVKDMKGYKIVLFALNSGGLTEEHIYDLFEQWFSLGKSDEETAQISRALSSVQINTYKANNKIK